MLGVPLSRTSIYVIPSSVPMPTIWRVNPVSVVKTDQFVGNVPGVPATAPTIVLLRMLFVLASSTSNPRLSPVVGLWSKRGTSMAAVCNTPSLPTYVPVLARVEKQNEWRVDHEMLVDL